MKGKITKDILMRVGKGVVRIPRTNDDGTAQQPQRYSPAGSQNSEKPSKENTPKDRRS